LIVSAIISIFSSPPSTLIYHRGGVSLILTQRAVAKKFLPFCAEFDSLVNQHACRDKIRVCDIQVEVLNAQL
jgi:hypothetical protein